MDVEGAPANCRGLGRVSVALAGITVVLPVGKEAGDHLHLYPLPALFRDVLCRSYKEMCARRIASLTTHTIFSPHLPKQTLQRGAILSTGSSKVAKVSD